jgi:hypothetical protein
MELELNTWERLRLTQILGEMRGVNLATLRKAGKALDALELSDDDRDLVGFQATVDANGELKYRWQNTKHEFSIKIADREAAALLRRAVEQYQGWSVRERGQAMVLAEKVLGAPTDELDATGDAV